MIGWAIFVKCGGPHPWLFTTHTECAHAHETRLKLGQTQHRIARMVKEMARRDPGFVARYRQAILERVLQAAMEITRADMGNVQLLDRASCALRIQTQYGFSSDFLEFFDHVDDGQAACGTALKQRSRVVIEDVATSPVFAGTPALTVLLEAGVRAVQSTPIVSHSGHVLGIVSTHWHSPLHPPERALFQLDLLVKNAAGSLERSAAVTRDL